MRRVHPDKNGTNPDSTLAQQNLADAYAFLQREREREREREIEIERETEKKNERERNKIRVEQREEKRKRENEFNIKREKERQERYEVRDSSTSESYSDDSSIGSLLLKGFAKRQHQKNAAMEEKRKKEKRKNFAAKKNELKILEKKLVSQRRSNGSDWYRGKKNRTRRGYGDTKKGMSEDKVGGNFDLSVQCDNCQKWRKVHTRISWLSISGE